ncbi:Auxin-responsive protein SAUR36 [Linum perenne]
MRRFRGFKLGKGIFRISNWIFSRRRRNRSLYNRLISPYADGDSTSTSPRRSSQITSRLRIARSICNPTRRLGSGYSRACVKPVPKGQLAVYVGQKDGDGGDVYHRVLVPVIYINHPLFGELLKEAQEEYGFDQEGELFLIIIFIFPLLYLIKLYFRISRNCTRDVCNQSLICS